MFADVTSANIVGYTITRSNAKSLSMGCPFVNISNNGNWKLGQLLPKGIDEGFEFIQFLEPTHANVYLSATWYNYEEYGDEGGWCNVEDESELLNDMEIDPDQAFLGNIGEGTTNLKFIFPAAIAK